MLLHLLAVDGYCCHNWNRPLGRAGHLDAAWPRDAVDLSNGELLLWVKLLLLRVLQLWIQLLLLRVLLPRVQLLLWEQLLLLRVLLPRVHLLLWVELLLLLCRERVLLGLPRQELVLLAWCKPYLVNLLAGRVLTLLHWLSILLAARAPLYARADAAHDDDNGDDDADDCARGRARLLGECAGNCY